MWMGMFLGNGKFIVEDSQVKLHLEPLLPGHMFDENGDAAFMLCGTCRVTYHNPKKANAYGTDGVKITRMLVRMNGTETEVDGDTLPEALSLAVREGKAEAIEAWME
jgi:hypothetical protein